MCSWLLKGATKITDVIILHFFPLEFPVVLKAPKKKTDLQQAWRRTITQGTQHVKSEGSVAVSAEESLEKFHVILEWKEDGSSMVGKKSDYIVCL